MCEICYDDFEKSIKPFTISCCELKVCIECIKQHLLIDNSINPTCFKCKSSIPYCDLNRLDNKWLKTDYKQHLSNLLFENEILSKVNETMIFLDIKRRLAENKKLIKEKNKELEDYLNENMEIVYENLEYKKMLNKLDWKDALKLYFKGKKSSIPRWNTPENKEIKQLMKTHFFYDIETWDKKINEYNIFIEFKHTPYLENKEYLEKELKLLRDNTRQIENEDRSSKKDNKVIITYNCQTEECRGMMNEKGLCIICNVTFCKYCFEPKKKRDHKCDEDKVATVKMIQKDAKPCPSCKFMIIKSSGCNQIFCTNCGTAFDWLTLKIEKGIIHNPHAHEYFQNHPEERLEYERRLRDGRRGGNGCNNFPDFLTFAFIPEIVNREMLDSILQSMHDFEQVFLPRESRKLINDISDNRDLRRKYIVEGTSIESLKSTLCIRNKKKTFLNQFHMIIMNSGIIIGTVLWKVLKAKNETELNVLINKIYEIVQDSNRMIKDLENIFKYKNSREIRIQENRICFPCYS